MKVKLKEQVRVPNSNQYVNKGETLEVLDVFGAYSVCRYKDINVIIENQLLEVVYE